jgi:UDP-N-acetylglucosamine--dolichyl-phosphate N-acetylglucosaminephosphotransferase
METITVLGAFLIPFMIVYVLTPWIIRYLNRIGVVVKDQNKENKPLIPISGGLAVLAGICAGLMFYIFMKTFVYDDHTKALRIFAATTSIIIITIVGFIDDLLIKNDKTKSTGLRQWQKPLLTLAAAIPLMIIREGTPLMLVPLIGRVDFGLLYPLILVPIGVVGAANMVNMLAGFNGLETGLGLIYTATLGIYAYINNRPTAALICFVTFASLLAFFKFNRYPAKILPGDSLTYLLGAILACVAVIGNMEKAAIVVSIPFFLEFLLKARSRFRADSFGIFRNGKIHSKYQKIYSLTHIFTRTGKYNEQQIVYFIFAIEILFCIIVWFV